MTANEIKAKLRPLNIVRENVRFCYTVLYKDIEYKVPLRKFQTQKELPDSIDVLIKEEDGQIRIVQDTAPLIRDLYKVGEVYPFRVSKKWVRHITVVDTNGFFFKLVNWHKEHLVEGQRIKAKVLSIDQTQVQLELVSEDFSDSVPFKSLATLAQALSIPPESRDSLDGIFSDIATFDSVKKLYDDKNGEWLLELIVRLDNLLMGIDKTTIDRRSFIDIFQALCIYSLEQSDILKNLPDDERSQWIETLTAIAQHGEDYKEAYRIMQEGREKEYIMSQLDNLKESENLYMPERKFRIMMCIFNLNENLMSEMMDRIFDIIIGGNKSHWKAEPFRTAFVNMLELFIGEHRGKAIRSAGVDLIHKMIKAIAIQQMLSTSQDNIDRRVNRATFYRLLAYIERYSSDQILRDAVNSLVTEYSENVEYDWSDINVLGSLYAKAVYRDHKEPAEKQRQVYRSGSLELVVDNSQITIGPLLGAPTPILPNGLVSWNGLSVKSNYKIKKKLKNKWKVTDVGEFWDEIEDSILKTYSRPAKVKSLPPKGEIVTVKVIEEDEEYEAFYCEIVSDDYEGTGWLELSEIARYMKGGKSNMHFFRDEDGNPLIFEAEVIGMNGEEVEFSMLGVVRDYFNEIYNPDSGSANIITCNIREQDRRDKNYFIAVSEEGASCKVRILSGDRAFERGTVADVQIVDINETGQYICEFVENSDRMFKISDCFRNLIYALSLELESDDTETQLVDSEMSVTAVTELIYVFDRLSVLTDNRTEAYSYLAVAKILSKMTGNDFLVNYYSKRQSILELFEDYETNAGLDKEKFDRLIDSIGDDLLNSDYQVSEAINKFRILDSLKHRDNVERLYEIRMNSQNNSIRNAADLAICVLLSARFELPNVERLMEDRINAELGVKVKTSKMKDYGLESQDLEHKSSVIFPADNHMQAAPFMQGAVIMQTICGFLNSNRGGTLNIGVNKNGAACGVENDLKHLKTDQDGYERYIRGMINRELGQIANQCCTDGEWISDEGYLIYAMHIRPCPELVAFRGEYWTRMGTEKRPLKEENVETFRKSHHDAYQVYMARMKSAAGNLEMELRPVSEETASDPGRSYLCKV